jgi:dihydroorotase/N-acyl-D-amino-acid deacylase
LAEAIRKMTSLPAERMGLSDRGQIKVGYRADLTIFDPQTIREVATFTDPHHYPEGIVHVLVNGQWAIRDGALVNGKAGKVLRGPGYAGE